MNTIAFFENTNILKRRISNLLSLNGYQCIDFKAVSLKNTIQFSNSFDNVDIILVDIDNFGFDTKNFMEELKKAPHVADKPIIAISMRSDIRLLKQIITRGCVDFIMKPFDNTTFLSKIQKYITLQSEDMVVPEDEHEDEIIDLSKIQLIWSDDYKLGIEQIDSEHKSLFDNFHTLYSHMRSGEGHAFFKELITYLDDYVDTHFSHEEAFQEEINYPRRHAHKELHLSFTSKIKQMIEDYRGKEITDSDLIRFNLFLQDWLIHHVLIEDQKYTTFLSEQKEKDKPEEES